MPGIRSEPRIAIMALVDLSWEDQFGTRHSTSAKLEDTSPSGACVRLKVPVSIGSIMKVNSHRERFSGTARYCRNSGRDFIIGIQKDKASRRFLSEIFVPTEPVSASEEGTAVAADPTLAEAPVAVTTKLVTPPDPPAPRERPNRLAASVTVMARRAAVSTPPASLAAAPAIDRSSTPITDRVSSPRPDFHSLPIAPGTTKEGTNMANKWSDLAPWRQKQSAHAGENPEAHTNQPAPRASRSVDESPAGAGDAALESAEGPSAAVRPQGDLLSMDDIYRAAGIMTPRMGYSICKVADMLSSDHLRGLSDEMKRASVLMALEAASIPVDEILRDATLRQSAINSYESDQWQQFEEYWAAKSAENAHIQGELERVTAQYQERIKRNLDEVAREKVIFAGWQSGKQQEAQRIAEAAEICSKPSLGESLDAPESVSRSFAAGKPA